MTEQKFIIPDLDILTKRTIVHDHVRLKSSHVIDLLDQFLSRWVSYKRDWIRLNSRVLKHLYGSQYSKILDWLVKNDVLYLYKNYSVGIKSKTYRLTDSVKKSLIINASIEMPDKLAKKKTLMMRSQIDDDVKAKMFNDLSVVKIDKKSAIEWCDRNMDRHSIQYISNTMSINRIAQNSIYSHFDKYGRFHTNFTVLKKEIRREFLSMNGNSLSEIDIKNSQPFFLWLLMKESGFDAGDFAVDVLEGHVYEKMRSVLGCTRKEAKVAVYRTMFGRNVENDEDLAFVKLYPKVYEWILDYKAECKSYKALAQRLQQRESDFVFMQLIPKIVEWKNVPLITVHDSIMFERQHEKEINEIFQECKNEMLS